MERGWSRGVASWNPIRGNRNWRELVEGKARFEVNPIRGIGMESKWPQR